ncbi:hypothetical protein SEVIR_8G250466v4 [Setaria viridis]|uniref:Protein kinase domain-containing protein n=1 Tax=Setaria viridis TaxID=4556 RepID=A0A4V6D3H1_SETVI|nr:wall-associated receptor kinase 1-like [Setaria viridis]TKW02596.1 hypothetical protein SEVIR_8G250466v2 [Setaria viridis]
MAPLQVLLWHLLVPALVTSHLVAAASNSSMAGPEDCHMCGNIEIPYPFGIGKGCGRPGFNPYVITCNDSFSPPRPYLVNVEIASISPGTGEIRVFSLPSSIFYNLNSPRFFTSYEIKWTLTNPFVISERGNEFTAIGCSTVAMLKSKSYYTGCISYCSSIEDAAAEGDKCTGLGCCQIPISGNLSTTEVLWTYENGTTDYYPWQYNKCMYAFVAEKGWYKFSRQDLILDGNNSFFNRVQETKRMPVVLEWAIRDDGSCPPPPKDGKPTAPACVSTNSFCVNATQGSGYLCNCSDGYTGNPYVTGDKGCKNINECSLRKSNPEKYKKQYPCYGGSTCIDTQGGYKCKCKFGLKGDGKSENGCQPIFPVWAISILVIIVVAVVATFAIFEVKRRKHRRFFDRNGGDILKSMGINIFTEGQLKKITNGYKKSIGEGAFGKVYIGMTDDSQQVAVKCSTAKGDVLPQEEFVNEITFQFRISHTNLVRLVGCCLETDVPMLVFEFVPRGSLHSVLHGAGKTLPLSMPVRLDIAIGSAEALAYMHSHGGHNHVHGDIKSGNILLDDNLTPKVSDFGSAKLVSVASRYSKWCVSGDMSYIDPIYIKSGRFTEKSDVYSFGVVLLELVTRKPAKYGDNSLYIDFIRSFKEEGNGRKLYDEEILSGDDDARSHHHMECLDRISRLAVRCLKEDVDERPTMAEVVEELKEVKAIASGGSSSVAS